MNMSLASRRAAFFDVDGTIISTKSLISFIQFLAVQDIPGLRIASIDIFLRQLAERYKADVPREALNRYYFSILRGLESRAIEEAGQRWFRATEQTEGFYIAASLNKIAFFKSKAYRVVLVSGSFLPLLTPLSEKIGFDDILCTTPECVRGRYTGELIGKPCIGQAKRDEIVKYALLHDLDLTACWAFGDDASDIPMLDTVGNGVRIGTDGHEQTI